MSKKNKPKSALYRPLNPVQALLATMMYHTTKGMYEDRVAIDDFCRLINPEATDQQIVNRVTELIVNGQIEEGSSQITDEGAKMLTEALTKVLQ